MGRNKNTVPSYLLHRASGQARVRINGRDIYLGPHDSPDSKEKYARLIAEHFSNESEQCVPLDGSPISIAALVVKYDDHCAEYYRKNGEPTSQIDRIRRAMRPLIVLYGSTAAHEFSPKKLKAVRTTIVDDKSLRITKGKKRTELPLSRGYVNSLISCIKRMFKWAVAEELLSIAVYQALGTVESLKKGRALGVHEPKPIKPVPTEYVSAVVEAACPQIAAMIQLQLLTGMRPDEVTIMRPCDIDANYESDLWLYVPESHKTEHHDMGKELVLGPQAQLLVTQWLDRDDNAYLFSPREVMEAFNAERRKNRKTPMTPSQAKRKRKSKPRKAPGERYDDESYARAVKAVCKRLKIPSWTPGRLRHNAGTDIRKLFGIETAKIVLGHQELSTTEIYAERDREHYEEVMRKVG